MYNYYIFFLFFFLKNYIIISQKKYILLISASLMRSLKRDLWGSHGIFHARNAHHEHWSCSKKSPHWRWGRVADPENLEMGRRPSMELFVNAVNLLQVGRMTSASLMRSFLARWTPQVLNGLKRDLWGSHGIFHARNAHHEHWSCSKKSPLTTCALAKSIAKIFQIMLQKFSKWRTKRPRVRLRHQGHKDVLMIAACQSNMRLIGEATLWKRTTATFGHRR